MTVYVVRRLAMLIPIMLGVTFLTASMVYLNPGDPIRQMLGWQSTPELINGLREKYRMDEPFWVQYGLYLWDVLHGDLGNSIRSSRPVLEEITARFPKTLQLTLAAMLIAVPIGVGAGIVAATTKRRLVDGMTMVTALTGLSIPNFWLGILLILVFGVRLKWVSVIGGEGLKSLILPALALASGPAAVLSRLTRSCILEVFREDYVRTARAKGVRERIVILRHVLRNALIPVVTVMGGQFRGMLTGSLFIEVVFARPGLGAYAVNAISQMDLPQMQGMVLFSATVIVLANLVVDLLYGVLDPRIRLT